MRVNISKKLYYVLRRLASEGLWRTSESVVFCRLCAMDSGIEPPRSHSGLETRIAEKPADVIAWRNDGADFISTTIFDDICENFTPAARFYCVFADNTLAHWSRMTTDVTDKNFRDLFEPLAETRGVFLGPCYTNPVFRGRRIYGQTLERICQDAAQAGIRDAFIHTRPENTNSFAGITHAGFELFARVTQTRILFWSRWSARCEESSNHEI